MLSQLSEHGVSLVKNVPTDDEETILKVKQCKGRFTLATFVALFNAIFVALKLHHDIARVN